MLETIASSAQSNLMEWFHVYKASGFGLHLLPCVLRMAKKEEINYFRFIRDVAFLPK